MISRCCCLLWLNIQTKSVCTVLREGGGLIPASHLPESSTYGPKCTVSVGPIGEAHQHDTLLAAGLTSTRVTFCFLLLFCFLVLERLRRSRQLGHSHVDHDAGGAQYNGLRNDVSLCGINTIAWTN